MEWIQKENRIYTLAMKTSIEDATYSELVSRICKKMKRNEDVTKLKLSYTPDADQKQRPSIIEDDEELYVYITSRLHDTKGSILHVEALEDCAENLEHEERSRDHAQNLEHEETSRDYAQILCVRK